MANTFSNKQLRYWIVPGFLGGKLHSKALRRSLGKYNFKPAKSPQTADIIITHSGGVYELRLLNAKPKLLMLTAPALTRQNSKSVFKEANKRIWKTAKQQKYLPKRMLWSIYSAVYGFKQPRRNLRIMRTVSDPKQKMPLLNDAQVLFIINQNDPWPDGPQLPTLIASRPWAFISLPGAHEQIWEHPEQYVEILEYYAKRLVA